MVVQKLRLTTSYTITPLLVNFFPGIHILTILVALLISLTWLVFWNSGPGFGAHPGGARTRQNRSRGDRAHGAPSNERIARRDAPGAAGISALEHPQGLRNISSIVTV